jgi:hypothetical protein
VTTRYRRPTTIRPVVEEDTSQALVEGLINENISIKSFNLSNGIRIFIMVLKSFLRFTMVLKSFAHNFKLLFLFKTQLYYYSCIFSCDL